jgi:hypothetical protein
MLYEQDGTVNHQITDSVTQTMAHVVGHSPSETKSMLDALMAETIGMAMYNAVTNQHNAQVVGNATVIAACARMLKAPVAVAPVMSAPPVAILTVTPSPIPLASPQQVITVVATGLQNGFSVSILTEDGTLLATLSGSTQITYVTGSSSFTFQTDVFTTAGTYFLRIQNPPVPSVLSVPSPNFKVTVASVQPQVKSISPAGPETYHVVGNCFHPNMAAEFEDAEGNPVPGASIKEVRPGLVILFVPQDAPPGPFRVTLTNPSNQKTTRLFHKAVSMVSVATVYQSCEGSGNKPSTGNAPCAGTAPSTVNTPSTPQPSSNAPENPGHCTGQEQ